MADLLGPVRERIPTMGVRYKISELTRPVKELLARVFQSKRQCRCVKFYCPTPILSFIPNLITVTSTLSADSF